jgi:hypothetical protein
MKPEAATGKEKNKEKRLAPLGDCGARARQT